MKFLSATLAAVLAALTTMTTTVDARSLAGKTVNRSKVMRKAIKVDRKTLRRLEQNNEDFEITADKSIQFSQCVSLKTQAPDEDIMFGDLYDYTKAGQVVAEKSYVLFNICDTQYCSYQEDDEDAVYMVDLATYMGALVNVIPDQRQNYCEACEEAQDYCQ